MRPLGYREWVVCRQLIGRAFEVALLDRALRAVIDGRGGVLHIVGEAGAGKTTLLDVVHCEATAAGLQVRTTTIDESDQRRRLACSIRLLPSLATVRQGDSVGAALAAMDAFGTTPTVMLVDDVQWSDSASSDVLAAIARRAEDLGVLLVTTARTHSGYRDQTHVPRPSVLPQPGQRLVVVLRRSRAARPVQGWIKLDDKTRGHSTAEHGSSFGAPARARQSSCDGGERVSYRVGAQPVPCCVGPQITQRAPAHRVGANSSRAHH